MLGVIEDGVDLYQRNRPTARTSSNASADQTYADITRRDFENYLRDYRGFEERLIAARDDTSLIDQARVDAEKQAQIAADIQKRNIQRYGGAGLSVAQRQEQERAMQRGGALNLAGATNLARIAQRDINQATLADLINIGQGVNRSALSGLAQSASLAAQRESAYRSARAQNSANMMGLGGTLGSLTLMAFGI
jgi:hypothetical protein